MEVTRRTVHPHRVRNTPVPVMENAFHSRDSVTNMPIAQTVPTSLAAPRQPRQHALRQSSPAKMALVSTLAMSAMKDTIAPKEVTKDLSARPRLPRHCRLVNEVSSTAEMDLVFPWNTFATIGLFSSQLCHVDMNSIGSLSARNVPEVRTKATSAQSTHP